MEGVGEVEGEILWFGMGFPFPKTSGKCLSGSSFLPFCILTSPTPFETHWARVSLKICPVICVFVYVLKRF